MSYIKIYLSILIMFICLSAYNIALAQTSLQNANVDQYTDAQVKEMLDNGKARGLSDAQIVQNAQSAGLPSSQIQRLESRINDIRQKENNTSNIVDTSRQATKSPKDQDAIQPNQVNNDNSTGVKIFGADLFKNNKSNAFESSLKLATPVNYIVGPDDQLIINVYGKSVMSWSPKVSPEGNINITSIGILKVAGKTIEQVTADIKNKLIANNYAIGNGTSLSVTLGDIRSIKVIIQGQVFKSGSYTVSSLSTVMNALFQAGGPNNIGSYRNIEVIRNSRVYKRMDIYDFLVKDSQKGNITLQEQDIIRVPTYRTRVELSGEVKIPALFEVLPGETLQDVINFSGGFTELAYTERIKVDRVTDQQRSLTDVVESDFNTFTPLRGDKYYVEKILNRYQNRIIISGAVFRPGDFELQKGLTLSQLIKNAGGLKEDAFMTRGSILRLNSDNTRANISFNVTDVLTKTNSDIILQREDVVNISSIFDLRDQYKVAINGEVRKPGTFVYADSMKVADLIILAGGFTEAASNRHIEISRRIFDSDPSQRDTKVADIYHIDVTDLKNGNSFTLKPFDIVNIYSLPGYETQRTVKIEGEVMYPGPYTIQKKNERISDIIQRAGGLTASADVDGTSLKRDNDAVVGAEKTKIDVAAVNNERADRLKRLKQSDKDSTSNIEAEQLRNNFVGINLRKILQTPASNEDLILENGDVLRVPKQQQTVRVNGEVLFPSAVIYKSGKSFKGYVLNAGGFSSSSLKSGGYVVYPNGTVKGTRHFLFFNFHPNVRPGSEIFIPKKPVRKDNLQQILTLTTSIASLGAIIFGVLSLNNR